MNWVDWLILGILAYNGLTGFFKGFVRALSSLIAMVVATLAAGYLGEVSASLIGLAPKSDPFAPIIGSAVAWILVYLVLSIAGYFLSRRVHSSWLRRGDRWTGLIFGLAIGLLTVLLPLAFVDMAPLLQDIPAVTATREQSLLWRALRPLEPPVKELTRLLFGWGWEALTQPTTETSPGPVSGRHAGEPARKPSPLRPGK